MRARVSAWRPAGDAARTILTLLAILTLALSGVIGLTLAVRPDPVLANHTYDNPLKPVVDQDEIADSCADPSVIFDAETDLWYMYCTTDPLSETDTTFHLIPMFSSADLVNWEYEGDAFQPPEAQNSNWPDWAYPGGGTFPNGDPHHRAGLWAPEIELIDGIWYLFYGVTDMEDEDNPQTDTEHCANDNAIGVAFSTDGPLGPWTDTGDPVVDPRPPAGEPIPTCNFFWTFDPEVFPAGEDWWIYFGSYYGGIHGRTLDAEQYDAQGFPPTLYSESDPTSQVPITIPNRYEGAEVVFKDGYYYLFVSASACCNFDMTGYSVFAGRSTSPAGPYVDAQGISLLASRVGGTPVIMPNGNTFVGPGHNTVFQDFAGQWWTIYHAIDMTDPALDATPHINQRPAMLDPVDWTNLAGFPEVRGGCWASDGAQPAPAAQPGHGASGYAAPNCGDVDLNRFELVEELSDEFDGDLDPEWRWIREPEAGTYGVEGGAFRFDTQLADLFVDKDKPDEDPDTNPASVLVEPAPDGEYVVETRVHFNVPINDCCHNYRQAGLIIYGGDTGTSGDDAYVRLTHVSIWETRQNEFAKEHPSPDPRFGGMVVGPPSEWTFLRIHHIPAGGVSLYQAYTSTDADANGVPDQWVRAGVWTHDLGSRIGLVSMGIVPPEDNGTPTTARFDWVRVYALPDAPPPIIPPSEPAAPGTTTRPPASRIPNTSSVDGAGMSTLVPLVAGGVLLTVSAAWLFAERARSRRRSASK